MVVEREGTLRDDRIGGQRIIGTGQFKVERNDLSAEPVLFVKKTFPVK